MLQGTRHVREKLAHHRLLLDDGVRSNINVVHSEERIRTLRNVIHVLLGVLHDLSSVGGENTARNHP